MIRLVVAVMVLCSAALAAAAETDTPEGGQSLACNMTPVGMDQMDFKCPFVATGAVQRGAKSMRRSAAIRATGFAWRWSMA